MDILESIRRPIEQELERYQALFNATLTHEDDFLGRALDYIKSRKGKMMRPILTLLVAKACGEVSEKALVSAVTLEMLHTASLVHDDVVDESGERRGQASTNAAFGNQVAVLVGDYMLSLLLQNAAKTGDLRIVQLVSQLGGTLSEGEIYQLTNIRSEAATEEAYFRIIDHKTAALFAACAQAGALAMDASDDYVRLVKRFGEIVGICFQICDDIFDYVACARDIGKPVGNDMLEGKLTLPAIYALREHGTPVERALVAKVKGGTATSDDIARLVAFTVENGGIDYARRVMQDHRRQAQELLAKVENEAIRRSLSLYLDFVIERKS